VRENLEKCRHFKQKRYQTLQSVTKNTQNRVILGTNPEKLLDFFAGMAYISTS
jgi:hypothetical protein